MFGDGQLTVNWQAPPNEGSALTGYEVEIGGGLNSVIARGTATTYVWDGLTNGSNYQFRVVGRSTPPAAPTRRRGPTPSTPARSPTRPVCPRVQRGNRFLDLSWTPSPINGDPVIEYQVRMRVEPERLGAGRQRHHVPLVRPAQRRRAAVPGALAQP